MIDKQSAAKVARIVLALDIAFLTLFAASRVRAFFTNNKFPKGA